MLDDDPRLVGFMQEVGRRNGGRVFQPKRGALGEFVVADYLTSRQRRRGAAVPPAELRVGPSPIAGRGTFAVHPIPAGSVVVILDDPAALGALNHSCDPNLGWTDERTLQAARDIAPDEELTVDYATCIDDPAFVMMCHCETYRCRQVIEGTDWQIPQLQQRYAGRFTPAIRHRIGETSG